jgi:serine/threonine-protein kinase
MIKRAVKITTLLVAFIAITAASAYLALTLIIESEETVIVPELVGKEVVYALELLTGLELDIKVKGSEYSGRVPKHHVVFQQPAAGSEIKKGRDVKLVLSKGPETIILRDLTGLPSRQAQTVLENEGLCTGVVANSFHPLVDHGHVIAQYPFARAPIARSRCVDLLVSNGRRPEYYVMPSMAGMPLDKAVLLLEMEKLTIDQVSGKWDGRHPREAVLSQAPSAGTRISRGTPIQLVVNRRPDDDAPGGAGFSGRMHLFRHQTGSGYLRKKLRVEIGDGGGLNVLFNEFVKPGDEIWLAIPAGMQDRIFVYENDEPVKSGEKMAW